MFNETFYHSLFRKYVIAYGNCFDDIHIRRFDKTGKVIQNIPVPISYAPKRRWTVMRAEDQTKGTAITLPRMSFYINSFNYDPSQRKTSPLNQIVKLSDKKNEKWNSYNAIPYKIEWELYIIGKNYDDVYQIIEQINPYFNPDWTVQIKLLPTLDRSWDIPIRKIGDSSEEAYEGNFETPQRIIHTMKFEMDAWVFGPIKKSGVIKRIQLDFAIPSGEGPITKLDEQIVGRSERMVISPGLTIDGKPTNDPDETIPYHEITENDDYGFIAEIQNFADGKKYDPNTGKDVTVPGTRINPTTGSIELIALNKKPSTEND